MINKLSARFKTNRGVRIEEIQSTTNGDISSWYWVIGKANIEGWLIRTKNLQELHQNLKWWKEPSFLYSDINS